MEISAAHRDVAHLQHLHRHKGCRVMIHYSCDRCRRPMAQDEIRYVMRMEVQATTDDPVDMEAELDRDHLMEVHEILERMDECDSDELNEQLYVRKCFDLCADCREAIVANPMGSPKSFHNLPFSAN